MGQTNNIADTLKALQAQKGMNMTEFANEIGIPPSTLHSVETSGNTSLNTLLQIAKGTGKTLDELVFGVHRDSESIEVERFLLRQLEFFSLLSQAEQDEAVFHFNELVRLYCQCVQQIAKLDGEGTSCTDHSEDK